MNTSKKNFSRINSDFIENLKNKGYFEPNDNDLQLNELEQNENNIMSNYINNKKRVKRKRNENSEKRYLYNYSFFKNFPKPNNINKECIDIMKYSDKTKTYKLDTNSHKSYKKEKSYNNNMINLRILPNSFIGYKKFNSIESEFFDNHENNGKKNIFNKNFFMLHLFEELIDISNSLDNKSLLATLLHNFNQRYYLIGDKNKEEYMDVIKENENFEYIFKHFGLVLIRPTPPSKDELLYNVYCINVKIFVKTINLFIIKLY